MHRFRAGLQRSSSRRSYHSSPLWSQRGWLPLCSHRSRPLSLDSNRRWLKRQPPPTGRRYIRRHTSSAQTLWRCCPVLTASAAGNTRFERASLSETWSHWRCTTNHCMGQTRSSPALRGSWSQWHPSGWCPTGRGRRLTSLNRRRHSTCSRNRLSSLGCSLNIAWSPQATDTIRASRTWQTSSSFRTGPDSPQGSPCLRCEGRTSSGTAAPAQGL